MSRNLRNLTSEDLENILGECNDSEDGLDFSDDDDVADPTYNLELNVHESSDEDPEEPPDLVNEDQSPTIQDTTPINTQVSCTANSTAMDLSPAIGSLSTSSAAAFSTSNRVPRTNLIWKTKSLNINDDQLRFHGSDTLPPEILHLDTPFEVFSYLFTEDIIDLIRDQTNLYSVQKDTNKPINVTSQFIGIVYYMSIVRMPNVKMYWSEKINFAPIQETMPSKRFELLKQMLHFKDNSKMLPYEHVDSDRLYKIRPLIEALNNSFKKVPYEAHLSVDEQMCSTTARSSLKQYLPDKPHKWRFKLFVICGVSGYGYKFEVYSGQENKCASGEPQLGASANVVVRLAREVPTNQNYRIFFDNYYTSIPLIEYLSSRGILALGTIRKNRIPNCKLPDEKVFKKEPRGTSIEQVANCSGVDVAVVAWRDNKIVNLASNFAGKHPTSVVRRWDKSGKQYISVKRPFVIAEYNRHMGGVDLLDCVISHYKIKLRSKRWYIRIFYHFLDMAMCNSWLLYRRIYAAKNSTNKTLNSADFRLEIAETLCKYKTVNRAKRRSDIECLIQDKKKKGPAQHVPPKDVRLDQYGHWPIWANKRIRCKFPSCTGYNHLRKMWHWLMLQ